MIDNEVLRIAVLAADDAGVGIFGTESDRTRAMVKAALECLLGNGLIEVKPESEWPKWFSMDPPYIPFERR